MSDTVTKAELAEVLRRIRLEARARCALKRGGGISSEDIYEALGMEIGRLSPPKVEAEWPKRQTWSKHWPALDVECYPIGVVGPVVELLRQAAKRPSGGLWQLEEAWHVLAAFDAACKGKP